MLAGCHLLGPMCLGAVAEQGWEKGKQYCLGAGNGLVGTSIKQWGAPGSSSYTQQGCIACPAAHSARGWLLGNGMDALSVQSSQGEGAAGQRAAEAISYGEVAREEQGERGCLVEERPGRGMVLAQCEAMHCFWFSWRGGGCFLLFLLKILLAVEISFGGEVEGGRCCGGGGKGGESGFYPEKKGKRV